MRFNSDPDPDTIPWDPSRGIVYQQVCCLLASYNLKVILVIRNYRCNYDPMGSYDRTIVTTNTYDPTRGNNFFLKQLFFGL